MVGLSTHKAPTIDSYYVAKYDQDFEDWLVSRTTDSSKLEKFKGYVEYDKKYLDEAEQQKTLTRQYSDGNRKMVMSWIDRSHVQAFVDRYRNDPDGQEYRALLSEYWSRG
jgi:hypothetical protein